MFCFFIYLESAVSDNRFTVKIPRKTSTLKKNVVMEDESSMLSNYRQMELRIFGTSCSFSDKLSGMRMSD
jgi:hypothetical protein